MQPQGHSGAPPPISPRMFPRRVARLNRRMIGVMIIALVALIMLALRMSARSNKTAQATQPVPEKFMHASRPPGMLGLPASYAALSPPAPAAQRVANASQRPHVAAPQVVQTPGLQGQAGRRQPGRAGRQPCVQKLTEAREAQLLVNIRTNAPQAGPSGDPAERALPSLRQDPLIALARNAAGDVTTAAEVPVDPRQAFLDQAQQRDAIYLQDRIQEPMSPYTVHAGTIIPASLLTGINSDLPGTIIAQVREPVYDSVTGNYLLIPQGTRLLGVYDSNVVFGHKRVLMAWQRLIFPNGASIQLEGMPGVDLAGLAGIKDTVNFHLWPLFRSVLLSTVLSVGSRLPAGNIGGNAGTSPIDEFAQQGAQNINAAGQRIVDRELGRQPTLEIRPGFSLAVMVHRDMILRPYEGS